MQPTGKGKKTPIFPISSATASERVSFQTRFPDPDGHSDFSDGRTGFAHSFHGTDNRINRSVHPGPGMNRPERPHPGAVAEGIGSIGVSSSPSSPKKTCRAPLPRRRVTACQQSERSKSSTKTPPPRPASAASGPRTARWTPPCSCPSAPRRPSRRWPRGSWRPRAARSCSATPTTSTSVPAWTPSSASAACTRSRTGAAPS